MSHTVETLGRGRTARIRSIVVLAALALGVAGCSSSSSPSATAESGHVIGIKLLAFSPDPLTVPKGTTVTFRNNEEITHTVTSGTFSGVDPTTGLRSSESPDGKFDFHLSGSGKSATYTFATAGTYTYYCSIHKGMNATVVVTP